MNNFIYKDSFENDRVIYEIFDNEIDAENGRNTVEYLTLGKDESIEEYIDKMLKTETYNYKMKCNMCDTDEIYHYDYKGTHIYVCDQCPNIQFEYVEPKDLDNLVEFMKERGN